MHCFLVIQHLGGRGSRNPWPRSRSPKCVEEWFVERVPKLLMSTECVKTSRAPTRWWTEAVGGLLAH